MNKILRPVLLVYLTFTSLCLFSQASDTVPFNTLFRLAVQNNIGLTIAGNEVEAAELSNTLGNAGFLPVVNIAADRSYSIINSNQEFYDGRSREAKGAHNNAYNAFAELSWTIFDGTRMFATRSKLDELEKQGQLALEIMMEELYVDLAMAYYQLVQEQSLLSSLMVNLDISRERKRLAQKKYDLGSASEIDLIQTRIDFGNDSTSVLSAIARIAGLKAEINNMLARNPSTPFSANSHIPINDQLDYESLIRNAAEQNKDMLHARLTERIREMESREYSSELLPELMFFGEYNLSGSNSQTGILAESNTYGPSYGIRVNYNLFNGMNNRLHQKLSRIEYENARLMSESVMNTVNAELLKTYETYRSAIASINIHSSLLSDARKNLGIAIELYQRGAINEIDFRLVQQKFIEAENNLLNSQYLACNSELMLLRLSGQLLDQHNGVKIDE